MDTKRTHWWKFVLQRSRCNGREATARLATDGQAFKFRALLPS